MRKAFRQRLCHIVATSLYLLPLFAHAEVVISSKATQNMNCSGGICAPTAENAVLNGGDLATMLAAGNAEVTTTGSGVQAKEIKLEVALSWSGATILALDAYRSISLDQPVTVAGAGGLTVTTKHGGNSGAFLFGAEGSVTFQNVTSQLIIDGKPFTLESSLPTLAAAVAANSGGYYALANSYDASQDGIYDRSPIGTLLGSIEGLGNTITRLSIVVQHHRTTPSLVKWVKKRGAINNLRLTRIRYRDSARYSYSGGLVGFNYGHLFGDQVTGAIDAKGRGGGYAGGLVGFNLAEGVIVACSTDVAISVSGGGGGLVELNYGTVILSHADGSFSGGISGGFVGLNEGVVSEDFATGAVSGGAVGGFAGNNEPNGSIENSYATGAVVGSESAGFVSQNAFNGATVSVSYSAGAVQSEAGGFVCDDYPDDFSNDYWNVTTSGTMYGVCFNGNDEPQITGLTSKQLRSSLLVGFDPKIWAERRGVNDGFPYLIANPPSQQPRLRASR